MHFFVIKMVPYIESISMGNSKLVKHLGNGVVKESLNYNGKLLVENGTPQF